MQVCLSKRLLLERESHMVYFTGISLHWSTAEYDFPGRCVYFNFTSSTTGGIEIAQKENKSGGRYSLYNTLKPLFRFYLIILFQTFGTTKCEKRIAAEKACNLKVRSLSFLQLPDDWSKPQNQIRPQIIDLFFKDELLGHMSQKRASSHALKTDVKWIWQIKRKLWNC